MNAHWSPCFHADVAAALTGAKLGWVASADLAENFPELTLTEPQRAVPLMAQAAGRRGASVVVNGAARGFETKGGPVSGVITDVSGAAYQASKRGMLGMAHAIRMEEKQNGIRTCVICPGLVDTELIEKRPVKPSAEVMAQALQAEDVAEAVLFVAKLPQRVAIPELLIMPSVQ